ncbi:EAL domain-containing protein [uncultured Pseudokineococcus sp.]|uniref:putative bifunctional diguanylate cyclase/phosphodiesterase n=1 Tax=uncultured Pseudokineococcus sp. TaxID=1642928 RepID=UPI0026276D85|nr:EAL domain-containing protein [uncultured Pseudokineococcus sp.]
MSDRARSACIAVMGVGMAAVAVALLLGPLRDVRAQGQEMPWWVLVPLFAAAELVVVHVQVRRESLSISMAEVPLVLGLAFAAPAELVLASLLGSLVGLLHRRQLGLKLLLNLGLFALEAALAATVYHALAGGADPVSARGAVAALVTVVATDLVSAALLTAVIGVRVGELDGEVLREAVTTGLAAALATASVGLLVVLLVRTEPLGLLPLVVVLAVLALASRAVTSLSRGNARLELLHRFARAVEAESGVDPVSAAALREARDALGADRALLVTAGPDGVEAGRLVLDDDGAVRRAEPGPAAWWAPALAGRDVVADGGRDGLAAPLRAEGRVVGALVLEGRPHHLGAWSDDDRGLMRSLAGHAAVRLHNAHLLDAVRAEADAAEHLALHDPLTGLANRRGALRAVEARLAVRPCAAVLMVDVEGFTDVNDALGHDTGDALLREVARRLVAAVGRADHVARLGNDELAVLLPGATSTEHALLLAREVLERVPGPFRREHMTLDVRVCAGLAVAVEAGVDAPTLLQRADTALYAAKRERTGLRVWDAVDAVGSSRRLALLGDLRRSIAADELAVHYQPKVDPCTGRATGVEALVRWHHPEHGRVGPDEFIPLAEQSGLIAPLTTLVLRTALRDCARWRRCRPDLTVAVNVSARSLLDPGLPEQVADALAEAGLPGAALVLEITETAVMTDLDRALQVLHALRRLGAHLSVDDFGTGQSSLAYLTRLPVDEMKIDRSFVAAMAASAPDAAVVRTAVDLGHVLGLSVVAEGVEDAGTLEALADLGCDAVQGYHLGRPMPAEELASWLARQVPAPRRGEPAAAPQLRRP